MRLMPQIHNLRILRFDLSEQHSLAVSPSVLRFLRLTQIHCGFIFESVAARLQISRLEYDAISVLRIHGRTAVGNEQCWSLRGRGLWYLRALSEMARMHRLWRLCDLRALFEMARMHRLRSARIE